MNGDLFEPQYPRIEKESRGTWLVQSVKHATPGLRAMNPSSMIGVEIT